MADQPRYDFYQESNFFPNGTSARPLPVGVIAVDAPRDEHLTRGTVEGRPAETFPFQITMSVLERGQQRYEIFCTPCHDFLGTGQGMAVRRGFRRPPPSFHDDRLRQAPPGHFFDVITNGFGAMPSYAAQVPAQDRWAIIAYLRALQLSRNATSADVPPDALKTLEGNKK